MRVAQAYLVRSGLELETERSLNQRERCGAGPGLRRAGNGIQRRAAPAFPLKTAEQFGQATEVHVCRGFEQPLRNLRDRTIEPTARKAERDQGIVVRPDRSIV